MSNITKKKENLEERLIFLNEEVSRLEKVKEQKEIESKNLYTSLLYDLSGLTEQKISAEKLILDLKNGIMLLGEDKEKKILEVNAKNEELKELSNKIGLLNSEVDEKTLKITELDAVLFDTKKENDNLVNYSAVIKKESEEMAEKLRAEQDKINREREGLNKSAVSIQEKEKSIASKEIYITAKEKELQEKSNILQSEKNAFEKEKEILVDKMKEINTKSNEINIKNQEATAQLASAQSLNLEATVKIKNINDRDSELKEREAEYLLKVKEVEMERRLIKLKTRETLVNA